MISPNVAVLGLGVWFGMLCAGFGCFECFEGHTYGVASEHESTIVGYIMYVPKSSKGAYRYEFSVNGAKVDDSSKDCFTPLAPGACDNYGPVLVHYSYEPYPNSRLEGFADASRFSYRVGRFLLSIGLPLLVVSSAGFAVLGYKQRKEHKGEPDEIHVVPGE